MTEKLPPNLLRLFAPRPPLAYLPPLDRAPEKRRGPQLSGIGEFLEALTSGEHDKDYVPTETLDERRRRRIEQRNKKHAEALKKGLELYDANSDPNAVGDPFKTLFVARLSYDVTEADLRAEFERYGDIASIHLVRHNKTGKSLGYAFVEFEREKDMKAAYKDADGLKLLGRRVMVDVERGRTVKGWRPRRLGGGLGGTRTGAPEVNQRYSGRELPPGQRPPPQDYIPSGDRGYGPPRVGSGYGPPRGGAPRDYGGPPRDYGGPPRDYHQSSRGPPPPSHAGTPRYDRGLHLPPHSGPSPYRNGVGYQRGGAPRDYDRGGHVPAPAPLPENGYPRGPPQFGEGDYHHHYHNLDSKSSAKMDYDSAYSVRSGGRRRLEDEGGYDGERGGGRRPHGSRSRSPRRDRDRGRKDDRDHYREYEYRDNRDKERERW